MRIRNTLIETAINKAQRSHCKYKISAIGLNKRGELVDTSTNTHRFNRKGGGEHAEVRLMRKHPRSLKTIIICRVNRNRELLPIHPCETCASIAKKLGIRILTIV